MWRWTLALMAPLAAGREQAHQRGDALRLHRIVDVALFLPALEKPGSPQDVEVMGQRRPWDLDRLLDLADRHLVPGLHQPEEDLEAAEMGEGLECLDVRLVSGQLRQRQAGNRLHISKFMELSNRCQAEVPREPDGAASERGTTTVGATSGSVGTSQRKRPVATPAPSNCAMMNAGASAGRMPENVSVAERASVTAGLANDVDAGNQ